MRIIAIGILLASAAVTAVPSLAQRNVDFEPGCTLPFEPIKNKRWIDGYCGREGSAGTAAGRAQNRAKNNFCASGQPADLKLSDFLSLQKAADDAKIYRKPKGIPSPSWRAKLREIWTSPTGAKVGEGDLVRFAGFIDKAFHAVEEHGESVNCKIPGADNNDIHLELGETEDPDRCDRIITEISPHFRPKSWTVSRLVQVAHQGHPIRVTGQLFWDASHSPCGPGEPEQWRASTWEVHPVYRIEVCIERALEACRAAADERWVDLDKWGAPWRFDDTEEAPVQDEHSDG